MIRESLPFYHAIAAEPKNDTPRLIYADWLEEQGAGARAEYIRLQCQRAASDPRETRVRWLRSQEKKLLREFGPAWFGSQQGKLMRRKMARGFIASTVVLSVHLANEADGLFRFGPIGMLIVHSTSGTDRHESRMVRLPNLLCIEELFIPDCHLTPPDIVHLAESPYVANLRRLDLSRNHVGDEGAEALMRSTCFEHLETLALADCGIHDTALDRFFDQAGWPRLRAIHTRLETGEMVALKRAVKQAT